MLKGICAEATGKAPAVSTGSTICPQPRLVGGLAKSLARIATVEGARVEAGNRLADSNVAVRLPENAPANCRDTAALA